MLLAALKHITLHLYATAKYCRTQKPCQVKKYYKPFVCWFIIINDCDIVNLNKQQQK